MSTSARALSHRDRAVLHAAGAGRCVSGRAAALTASGLAVRQEAGAA